MSIQSQLASGRKTAHVIRIACTVLFWVTLACTVIPIILSIVLVAAGSQSAVSGAVAQVTVTGVANILYISATFIVSTAFLIKILRSVEAGEPFAKANAVRLRWVGIIMMAGSLIKFAAIGIIAQTTGLGTLTGAAHSIVYSEIYHDIVSGISAFIPGLFVLVISFVFAYGARLQREHDQTV